MKYISTRDNYKKVSASEAIRLGMVPEGGLFLPEEVPELSLAEINDFSNKTYQEIAKEILELFLTDYTKEEIEAAVNAAYNQDNFSEPDIAPIKKLNEEEYILELWQGPTAAFKDMALQIMPHLLSQAIDKVELEEDVVILVATSGDTGKAALEGFKDVAGIEIIVFYPEAGVSEIQKRQMITTGGDNTHVVAVEGNFDDCQNSVKDIFGDKEFKAEIKESGYLFSSANSINWGRLLPQIIYYFAAYASLVRDGEIEAGAEINISVPTGNFGNIFAAYYAYRMGLPVDKFICASNENNVLSDFLTTGIYDINRDFKKTVSPSMDILISSNLERFLFEITGHDGEQIKKWYRDLQEKDYFEIDTQNKTTIDEIFVGEYATEEETLATIKEVYKDYDYLIDTHTAVGVKAYRKFVGDEGNEKETIIDSTANPYKFADAVLEAIDGELESEDEFEILKLLKEKTGIEIHRAVNGLDEIEPRHDRACNTEEIRAEIKDILEVE